MCCRFVDVSGLGEFDNALAFVGLDEGGERLSGAVDVVKGTSTGGPQVMPRLRTSPRPGPRQVNLTMDWDSALCSRVSRFTVHGSRLPIAGCRVSFGVRVGSARAAVDSLSRLACALKVCRRPSTGRTPSIFTGHVFVPVLSALRAGDMSLCMASLWPQHPRSVIRSEAHNPRSEACTRTRSCSYASPRGVLLSTRRRW